MRGATLWLLLACTVSGSALASTWSDLWSTPEQQAQHLLDSRHPATAAPLFKDPRRRGYAELRAGQYAQAAKSLAPLQDADSLYNRGNALAHTGQLRDALAAYDAALKQSPGNGDIVHNRDLIARALQKQQQSAHKPQGGGSGKQQSGAGGQQAGASGKQQGGAGGQQAGGSGKQQGGAGGQQRGSGQQGQHGDASASDDNRAASGGGQHGSAGASGATSGNQAASGGGQQPGHDQGNQQAQAADAQAGKSPGASGQQDGAGATRGSPQSASTAQPGSASQQQGAATPNAEMREARAAGETQPPPRSEQSLALDQWLRGIPDDSGELLRRKFLIEHMIKQRQGNPQ